MLLCRNVQLVAFGHMHSELKHPLGRHRTMIVRDHKRGTVFLNTAEHPRIQQLQGEEAHQFTVVTFDNKDICGIESVWVGVTERRTCRIVQAQPLLRKHSSSQVELWNSFSQEWNAHA
jgi:uncharacterized protein (TIGR04168 family)